MWHMKLISILILIGDFVYIDGYYFPSINILSLVVGTYYYLSSVAGPS